MCYHHESAKIHIHQGGRLLNNCPNRVKQDSYVDLRPWDSRGNNGRERRRHSTFLIQRNLRFFTSAIRIAAKEPKDPRADVAFFAFFRGLFCRTAVLPFDLHEARGWHPRDDSATQCAEIPLKSGQPFCYARGQGETASRPATAGSSLAIRVLRSKESSSHVGAPSRRRGTNFVWKLLPSLQNWRRAGGEGTWKPRQQPLSASNRPHPNPLPEGEGTISSTHEAWRSPVTCVSHRPLWPSGCSQCARDGNCWQRLHVCRLA